MSHSHTAHHTHNFKIWPEDPTPSLSLSIAPLLPRTSLPTVQTCCACMCGPWTNYVASLSLSVCLSVGMWASSRKKLMCRHGGCSVRMRWVESHPYLGLHYCVPPTLLLRISDGINGINYGGTWPSLTGSFFVALPLGTTSASITLGTDQWMQSRWWIMELWHEERWMALKHRLLSGVCTHFS